MVRDKTRLSISGRVEAGLSAHRGLCCYSVYFSISLNVSIIKGKMWRRKACAEGLVRTQLPQVPAPGLLNEDRGARHLLSSSSPRHTEASALGPWVRWGWVVGAERGALLRAEGAPGAPLQRHLCCQPVGRQHSPVSARNTSCLRLSLFVPASHHCQDHNKKSGRIYARSRFNLY